MIEILTTGIVYKNPKPHVRSVHAYFPSVAVMDNGEMLATFALGEAFEAANCRLNVARSKDMGETWALEGPVYPGTKRRLTSDYGRAQRFIREVNSSCVMVNASTRFADGNQLGLGAEIGISTTKLHSFGPMGLEDLTTTKFIVYGDGQVRE